MTKIHWLTQAKALAGVCSQKHKGGQGSKQCTQSEAAKATELQHAVGSKHGIHLVAYSALGQSLQDMINIVNAGQKDDHFS